MSHTNGKQPSIPIAIVGLSCRFPGDASTPSRFWDLLKNGKSGHSESTDRFNVDAFCHPQRNGTRQNVVPVRGGYFLKEDPYVFDAAFFNITAAEAMALDPRQRIAMEVAYEALENAGMPLRKVAGTQTACYMGSSMSDYRDSVARDFQNYPKYNILGVSDEMIANRISHFLDIHGPSATIQTACSSSLVATHIACQSLRSGESDMAIAGGVGLSLGTEGVMHLNNLGFLNPAGHSMSFDASAGGYGRGEGCGVLIMKRLDTAVRDGDNIRAVIRASGVNSDGWTQGVTMPSLEAQAALIKYVYESNGLDYSSTQFVEAHGTGTKVGDPIEAGAIHCTIGQGKSGRKKLYLGSVKPNIGHLEAAAGVASIIKGVLSLEHGLIPPNLNFSKPNPAIPLEEWNMTVPTKLTPWPAVQTKRMSISGFGMGGTNAHVVLDAATSFSGGVADSQAYRKRLFVLSSHDKAGFRRISKSLVEHLDTCAVSSPAYLADLAHTLAVARSGLAWRTACFAENAAELRERLADSLEEDAVRTPLSPPRVAFVFTGQGAQWAHMGIQMMERPVFSDSVARSTQFLKEMGCEWDPITELRRSPKESQLGLPEISQPICSVLQIALVDELRSWGVTPSKVVGHSSGEIAAAYTIGALSHRDALAAAYYRGTASSGHKMKKRNGGMMAVGLSRDDAEQLMEETKLEATVACVNSPSNVTISGDVTTLEALRTILNERGTFARRLKVEVAYHSSHMHVCSMEYFLSIAEIGADQSDQQDQERPITMVSSVTGSEIDPEELGPYYWIQNLVSPVLFTDAIKELVSPADAAEEKSVDLLVEVGPHSALGGPIEQILSSHGIKNINYTSMLVRGQNALDTSMTLAAELFRQGVPINVSRANGDSECRLLTDLPPYPWNHSERFSAHGRLQREQYAQQHPTRSLLGAMLPTMEEKERVWRSFIRLNDEPWLRSHMVGSTVVFPAAGMISVVLEAAQQLVDSRKTPFAFKLREISFLAAMALPENMAVEMTLQMRPHLLAASGSAPSAWWEFTMSSCAGPAGQLRANCRGLVSIVYEESRSTQMAQEDNRAEARQIADYRDVLNQCPETCSDEFFYERMANCALPYGEAFQAVRNCHPGPGRTCYDVDVVDIGETFTRGKLEQPFFIHAATLDAILQGWLGSTCTSRDASGSFGFDKPMLPSAIGEIEITAALPGNVGYLMRGVCRSHKHNFNEFSADISMFDTDVSRVLMSIVDFRTSPLDMGDAEESDGKGVTPEVDPADITSEVRWNYALDVMKPAEISQVVLNADVTATNSSLIQLLQMIIHQRPSLKIVELANRTEDLPTATVSKLPKGILLPNQVCYAVLDCDNDSDLTADIDSSIIGQPFALCGFDAPLPAQIATADLFLVHNQVSDSLKDGIDNVLKRLVSAAKPGADVLVATTADASNIEEIASVALKGNGFQLVTRIPADAEYLALYNKTDSNEKQRTGKPADSTSSEEVFILEPITLSPEGQSVSSKLQDALLEQNYSVKVKAGVSEADSVHGKTCISLLELEEPVLEDLSKSDFESIQKLMVSCERLLWLTGGDNPSFGIVDGLARCVNGEVAGSKFQVLHLSSEGVQHGPSLAMRILESSDKTSDNEFREYGGLLQVQRIYQSPAENHHVRNHLEDSIRTTKLNDDDRGSLRLQIGKLDVLDSLHFARNESELNVPLADDELELDVKATGVDSRDILASMGLVPDTALGYEASGIVLRTGSQAATSFKPGDRVSTISSGGTHATKTRCDARVTVKIPDSLSFEEAAAVPTVYATAYHALVTLAKLRQGQSVLIHTAAGGVGQAAVQLAQHLGLVVYCTVGTEEKRHLIMQRYGIAEENIFHSRDSSFARGIQRVTNGRGVDCVLNSLSGELLRESWNCLATFGTFVEIGMRNIADNTRLDMRPFGKSATFTFFELPALIKEAPAAIGEALGQVFKLLSKGVLQAPYPMTMYPVGEVKDAFRLVQSGEHSGKVVLSFSDEHKASAPVLCKAKDSLRLDPNATYLFIGGLGGLGRSLAKELVASGARHLAFISRSGDSKPEAKAIVNELAAQGAQVKAFCGDVADQTSFLNAMEQCSQQLPPVKGVFQMAMVLQDSLLENMSYDEWSTGLRPKVQGTWNIHQYFHHERPLDFMIFGSSISGICGNPGQAQYDAGNTYQDTLARYRRSQGLKAVSINLGIMLDVGVIAESVTHNFTVWEDVLGIREPSFHALMKSAINGQTRQRGDSEPCPAQIAIGLGTANVLALNHLPSPPWFEDARFGPLAAAGASTSAGTDGADKSTTASLESRLTEAGTNKDQAAATAIITEALVGKIAEILRIPASEVDPAQALYSYGVDSLVALEVRNWITREIKANMALLDIVAAVPMAKFAEQIALKSKLVNASA